MDEVIEYDSEQYALTDQLYVQQTMRLYNYLEVSLIDCEGKTIHTWRLNVYGGPSGFEDISVSPTGKVFAVFSSGNTGYEEDITYCAVLGLDQNKKLRQLYLHEEVGGSKYRSTYKAVVSWVQPEGFNVEWI